MYLYNTYVCTSTYDNAAFGGGRGKARLRAALLTQFLSTNSQTWLVLLS